MQALKLIEVDDEVGLILPGEILRQLRVSLGDDIHLTEVAEGFTLHSNSSKAKFLFRSASSSADNTNLHSP